MKRLIIGLILVLAAVWLSGCAPVYGKPGLTQAEFDRDAFECQYASQSLPRTPQTVHYGAMGNPVYSDPSMGWFDAASSRKMLDMCMKARGYTRE